MRKAWPTDLIKSASAIDAGNYQDSIPASWNHVLEDHAEIRQRLQPIHSASQSCNLGDYGKSEAYYDQALMIDPKHKGANEYLGELYLKLGQLEKAEAQLARLDDICFFSCEEYDDLKAAIETYKSGGNN